MCDKFELGCYEAEGEQRNLDFSDDFCGGA